MPLDENHCLDEFLMCVYVSRGTEGQENGWDTEERG